MSVNRQVSPEGINPDDMLGGMKLRPNYVYSRYFLVAMEGNFPVCDVHTYYVYKDRRANGHSNHVTLWMQKSRRTIQQDISKILRVPNTNELVITNP